MAGIKIFFLISITIKVKTCKKEKTKKSNKYSREKNKNGINWNIQAGRQADNSSNRVSYTLFFICRKFKKQKRKTQNEEKNYNKATHIHAHIHTHIPTQDRIC